MTATLRASGRALMTMAAVAGLVQAPLASAERLNDKDVKALIERIDHERDRFEDQLDGELKRSILRGPGGEVNVSKYLDDLQENVKRLDDRFSSSYAASAEVTTVLRQGSDIQRFMSAQPPNMDGASEWTRLSSSLGELAAAYGTTMPMPEGLQARRMGDREVKAAAEALAGKADRFKKDLDHSLKADESVDKTTRSAAVEQVEMLRKNARKLASTVGGGKPASGEAQAVLDGAARLRASPAAGSLAPPAQASWAAVEASLDTIAQAFGLPARLP